MYTCIALVSLKKKKEVWDKFTSGDIRYTKGSTAGEICTCSLSSSSWQQVQGKDGESSRKVIYEICLMLFNKTKLKNE
jgi:hypothetical protein